MSPGGLGMGMAALLAHDRNLPFRPINQKGRGKGMGLGKDAPRPSLSSLVRSSATASREARRSGAEQQRTDEPDQGQGEGSIEKERLEIEAERAGEQGIGKHLSPKQAFGNRKWALHRVTLQGDEPEIPHTTPWGQEHGHEGWNIYGLEQGYQPEIYAPGGGEGNKEGILGKALKLAADTCKSVANLWSPGKLKPSAPERIAVPALNLDKNQPISKKRKSQDVLVLARKARKSDRAVKALEEDFVSNSSRASKAAIRLTITKILMEAKAGEPVPPTVDKLKTLAGILKQAQYRAAPNYLGEFKTMAVELGYAWSDQLERNMKMCKRSVMRAMGPKKKAPEVPTSEEGKSFSVTSMGKKVSVVPAAKELFEFGVVWMLREIEISLIRLEHLKLDLEAKKVTLTLPVSKMDQEGASVSRTLQCLCESNTCCTGCPLRITAAAVFKAEDAGLDYISFTNKGKKATKRQLIREWQKLYGPATSGHSARRTGALRYIKHGWAIAQVAYLGKWKSSVIYEYAAEALESLPVNTNRAFISELYGTKGSDMGGEEKGQPDVGRKLDDVRNYLTAELAIFKESSERAFKALDFEVEALKKKSEKQGGSLAPYVQSINSKVVHRNWDMAACTPPLAWRTLCGWHYFRSDFIFCTKVGGGEPCKKCEDIARCRGGGN